MKYPNNLGYDSNVKKIRNGENKNETTRRKELQNIHQRQFD